jgi:hypothetical protein
MPKEMLHKQCFGRSRSCHCIIVWEDDFEDKDGSDRVESTDNNSVMSDEGECDK